jgi:hypothetical protein
VRDILDTDRTMKKILALLFAVIALTACSHHRKPLEAAKKERLVSELVSTAPQCKAFKDKLSQPLEDDDVDKVFHDALDAHCIHKDV